MIGAGYRRLVWRHPEAWAIAISVSAWGALIVQVLPHSAGAHPHHFADADVGSSLAHWMQMVVAMMLPLALPAVHNTAAQSLWRRRHRAMVAFLCGYLVVYGLAGLLVVTLIATVQTVAAWIWPYAMALACALAAIWQLTSAKRRALIACHRSMPLAPDGWRATSDCLIYGGTIASHCLGSCWALMLVCAVASHDLRVMMAISLFVAAERYSFRR